MEYQFVWLFSDFGCYTFDKHGNYLKVFVHTNTYTFLCSHSRSLFIVYSSSFLFRKKNFKVWTKNIIQVFKWILTLLSVMRRVAHSLSLPLSVCVCHSVCSSFYLFGRKLFILPWASSLSANVCLFRVFYAIPIAAFHLNQCYLEWIYDMNKTFPHVGRFYFANAT